MLIKCPECYNDMSNLAPSCPHCGFVLMTPEHKDSSKETVTRQHKKAIFQFISLGAIIVAFLALRTHASLFCLVVISSGIIALIRKEPRWLLSVASIFLGIFLISMSMHNSGTRSDYVSKMEIQKWEYKNDISSSHIWGRVKNVGDRTAYFYTIKALYKDSSGNVLDTGSTGSAETLPPGMSKEFEIFHKASPEYKHISLYVEAARAK